MNLYFITELSFKRTAKQPGMKSYDRFYAKNKFKQDNWKNKNI